MLLLDSSGKSTLADALRVAWQSSNNSTQVVRFDDDCVEKGGKPIVNIY